MPLSIAFIFMLIALVLFLLVGLGVESGRVNLLGLGLASLTLALMLGGR